MRVAVSGGRALLVLKTVQDGALAVDVKSASGGHLPADPHELIDVWHEFCSWAQGAQLPRAHFVPQAELDCPVPQPRQIFAIGLNYLAHGEETGLGSTKEAIPSTFTKYVSALGRPFDDLQLRGDTVDWEVELVVVIGRRAEGVLAADALRHVAGYAVGQDYSDRALQRMGAAPQYSLAKSFPGYGRIGPWIVTGDEIDHARDLQITCEVNGLPMQAARTSGMVWSVAELIEVLSHICPLLPGDVIFTGTPGGVGNARRPPRYLTAGDLVVSRIAGIGSMSQVCR